MVFAQLLKLHSFIGDHIFPLLCEVPDIARPTNFLDGHNAHVHHRSDGLGLLDEVLHELIYPGLVLLPSLRRDFGMHEPLDAQVEGGLPTIVHLAHQAG